MQEVPNVVVSVESPAVDIRRVRFGPGRKGFHQRHGVDTEVAESSRGVPQAQYGQPEQWTSRDCARPDLHTPVFDEISVLVVQRASDQDVRGLPFGGAIAQGPLQCLDHDRMR